jgi:hypothetical protein
MNRSPRITTLVFCLVSGLGVARATEPKPIPRFSVHEWGTFTTVHAPDGDLLTGLETEEERLPNFVQCHAGFAPANKGWSRPVSNVTVKMETPVLYVYSPAPFRLRAEVDFIGGSISQWFPPRVAGEVLPPAERGSRPAPVDFAAGFRGSIIWDVEVEAPGTPFVPDLPDWETPQWPRARVKGANTLRGPGETREGFLFYRGIGNFELPLRVSFSKDGSLRLENQGKERIPFVWIYDHRSHAGGRYLWEGPLAPGATQEIAVVKADPPDDRSGELREPLVRAGLSGDEADALLATWRESYFEQEGLRVFWLVPRAFTDRVLPLRLRPEPAQLERVLVGRSEVITPGLAVEIERGFRADGGAAWRFDRRFGAYRALAAKRGAVSSAETSAGPAP